MTLDDLEKLVQLALNNEDDALLDFVCANPAVVLALVGVARTMEKLIDQRCYVDWPLTNEINATSAALTRALEEVKQP